MPLGVCAQSFSNTSSICRTTSFVGDDDADLAPLLELESPQALAADERALAVADDRADVQPPARVTLVLDVAAPLRFEPADDPHVDAGLHPLRQQPQHRIVGRLRVVDQQLLARALDEPGEPLARVVRADDEALVAGLVRQAVEVGGEQPVRLVDQRLFLLMTPKLRLLAMSRPVKLKP